MCDRVTIQSMTEWQLAQIEIGHNPYGCSDRLQSCTIYIAHVYCLQCNFVGSLGYLVSVLESGGTLRV